MSETRRKIYRGSIYKIKQNDILNLHDENGFALGLVVSQDTEKSNSDAIKVIYLDDHKTKSNNLTHVQININNHKYYALSEYVQTIDISRITEQIGKLSKDEIQKLNQALTFGLGINNGYNPYGIYAKWEKYMQLYPLIPQKYKDATKPVTRGEIYYVTENPNDPSIGCEIWSNRAAVIVSNNGTNRFSNKVEIVYLSTSSKKRSKTHIYVTSGKRHATTLCEHIYTIDKSQLKQRIGKITESEETALTKALLHSLDIYKTSEVMPNKLFHEWEKTISKAGKS